MMERVLLCHRSGGLTQLTTSSVRLAPHGVNGAGMGGPRTDGWSEPAQLLVVDRRPSGKPLAIPAGEAADRVKMNPRPSGQAVMATPREGLAAVVVGKPTYPFWLGSASLLGVGTPCRSQPALRWPGPLWPGERAR